jgi:hypothetical protein
MQLVLYNQEKTEKQEREVIFELCCVGSAADLEQVCGQIVTASNCQEEDEFE